MSLETANPIIVTLILLPFVIISLCLVIGVLNHYWKHKEEEEPEYPSHWTGACEQCGTMENVGEYLCGLCEELENQRIEEEDEEP